MGSRGDVIQGLAYRNVEFEFPHVIFPTTLINYKLYLEPYA